ncbi:MAG: nitroreductase family protein [Acidimicrobiia bacterium]|jgi:nitroreductase
MTGDIAGPPFFDVVLNQRAHREYADTAVDDATIELVLRAGTHAPSAENKQPWEFVVVRDPALSKEIHDLTEAAWVGAGRAFSEVRLSPEMLKEVDFGIAGGGYRTAPVLVVVCADFERGLPATVGSSIFPCVQNMLLAASALGLGSALTTLGTSAGDRLSELLALPAHVVPQAIVPLGYPARRLGPPRREPATEHTHRDHYGARW